jgi:hypothetical protein
VLFLSRYQNILQNIHPSNSQIVEICRVCHLTKNILKKINYDLNIIIILGIIRTINIIITLVSAARYHHLHQH